MQKLLAAMLMCSVLVGCESTPSNSTANASTPESVPVTSSTERKVSLNNWINNDLTDYLNETLGATPKFRNQEILIVAMKNEQITGDINALTLDIRNQLMDNLLANRDIKLVRRQLDYQSSPQRSLTELSCDKDTNIQYYLGIDIDKSSVSGLYTVRVRATDANNPNEWVRGVSIKWTGVLSTNQQKSLFNEVDDLYLKGLRSQPFEQNEADLLAQFLSHNMGCLLAQSLNNKVILYTQTLEEQASEISTAVELVDNYLSRFSEVEQTKRIENANAILNYEYLQIDPQSGLSILTLSVNFVGSGRRLNGADTQAYIYMARNRASSRANNRASSRLTSNMNQSKLISEFKVIVPTDYANCLTGNPWADGENEYDGSTMAENDCFSVVYETNAERTYLVYQNTKKAVFLMTPECLTADAQDGIGRFPGHSNRPSAFYLDNNEGKENFYLIALNRNDVNTSIDRVFRNLPAVCSSEKQTLDAKDLAALLDKINALNMPTIDWKPVIINHGHKDKT